MKPVLAFAMGVVLASGIAYLAMGGKQEQKPAAAPQAATAVQPPAQPQPTPDQTASTSPDQTAKPAPATLPPAPEPKHFTATASSRHSALGRSSAQKPPATAVTPSTPAPVKQPEPAPQQVAQAAPPAPAVAQTPAPVVHEEPRQPEPPPKPEPHSVTIASGTPLTIRLEEALSSDRSFQGDQFRASLAAPLVVNGFVIAERGARVIGRVAEIDKGGKMKGVAHLGLELTSLTTADGQKLALRTERFSKQAETSHGRDAAKIGGGAALGAIIGAIAGGGKGAAIGAGVGGAAGAGDVALTRGKAAELSVESKLTFRLADSVTVTERLNN